MGVKMGWIQIEMGHPLARNGAALAPFRANGAHPSNFGLGLSERIESPNFVGIVDFRFQNIGQNFNASVHVGFK